MSEINFDTGEPIFQVELYHNTPDTPGYWTRAMNAEDEEKAIEKAITLFEGEGLPSARIVNIVTWELSTEGGEDAG